MSANVSPSSRLSAAAAVPMSDTSTTYFLLLRPATDPVHDASKHQIVHVAGTRLPSPLTAFLLPTVNLDHYSKHGLFEANLIEWSKQFCRQDGWFLDIGAHTGTYALALAPLCGGVMAFEPQRSTFYALCGSVALSGLADQIDCRQCGLGSLGQVGERTLHIVSKDGGGSSLHASPHGDDDPDDPHSPASTIHDLRQERIQVRTLDSFGLQGVGFIKMDVEGNELEVLRGGMETLQRSGHPPILMEVNTEGHFQRIETYLREIVGYNKLLRVGGTTNMALAVREM